MNLTVTHAAMLLLLCGGCHPRLPLVQTHEIPLSAPAARADRVFFEYTARITAPPPAEGCRIHYTTDGELPTAADPVLDDTLTLDATTHLNLRTLGNDHPPGPVETLRVFKVRPTGLTFAQGHGPTPPYDAAPATILTDRRKGGRDFRSGEWWGYRSETIVLEFTQRPVTIRGVVLSFLEDQGSWIFGPARVRADFYDAVGNHLRSVSKDYPAAEAREGVDFRYLELAAGPLNPTRIRVEITCLSALPDRHPGAGERPWLFIDEILIQ